MNVIENKELQFIKQFTQNLINSNIDASISNKDDFIPWAVSSLVEILHDNKIFISSVYMLPNSDLNQNHFSFKISAKSKNQTYVLDLMLISNFNFEEFNNISSSNKVILLQLENITLTDEDSIMKFIVKFDFFNIYKDKNKCLIVLSNN